MPVHDWTRVDAGICHAFHHWWGGEISGVLNEGLLPPDYYALPEQDIGPAGPDVLTLQLATGPRSVIIRHISDHRVVALVEVVSPGNKSSRQALRTFVEKATNLLG